MTFRVSKYTYNSWKTPALDKNAILVRKGTHHNNFYGVLWLLVITIHGFAGSLFWKKIVRENKIINDKFVNRKSKQLAFDYMIYSQSRKDAEKNVDMLSLV